MEASAESERTGDTNRWTEDIRNNIKNIETLIAATDEDLNTAAGRRNATLRIGHELGCIAASSEEAFLIIDGALSEGYKKLCSSSQIGQGSQQTKTSAASQEDQGLKAPEDGSPNQLLLDFSAKKQKTCGICNAKGHNSRTCRHGATEDDMREHMQNLPSWVRDGYIRMQRWHQSTELKVERQKICSQCKEKGHNSRTCSKRHIPVEDKQD